MKVTVDLGGVVEFLLLGEVPGGDDKVEAIGLSTVAILAERDPGHVFLVAARWHDACYQAGSSIQAAWPRWKVDLHFLEMMIDIAHSPTLDKTDAERYELEREALALYLMVRKYGQAAWEGKLPENEGPV